MTAVPRRSRTASPCVKGAGAAKTRWASTTASHSARRVPSTASNLSASATARMTSSSSTHHRGETTRRQADASVGNRITANRASSDAVKTQLRKLDAPDRRTATAPNHHHPHSQHVNTTLTPYLDTNYRTSTSTSTRHRTLRHPTPQPTTHTTRMSLDTHQHYDSYTPSNLSAPPVRTPISHASRTHTTSKQLPTSTPGHHHRGPFWGNVIGVFSVMC